MKSGERVAGQGGGCEDIGDIRFEGNGCMRPMGPKGKYGNKQCLGG
ncbi:MAG: hypothetical protein AB7C91_12890 [Sphaerochaeta sp.]